MNGDYGPEEAAMQSYLRAGERRAASLGNRGPIRFTASGALHPEIVEAYWRCGFYVFEGVLKRAELDDIEHDLHDILDRLPFEKGALVDAKGRPSYVTSAGSGPSVGKHLLMAYLPAAEAVEGNSLLVEYMGEQYPVTVARASAIPLFDPENSRIRS